MKSIADIRDSALWGGLTAALLLLALVGGVIVHGHWREHLGVEEESARRELGLVATVVRMELQHGNYQAVEPVLQAWGSSKADVASLSVVANGISLGSYHRALAAESPLALQAPLQYAYAGEAVVNVVLDQQPERARLANLSMQIGAAFILLSALLILLMRLLLVKRQESRALLASGNALWETNAELQREVALRQQMAVELQRSRELLANAQDIAHLGSWEWDLASGSLRCSDELLRIMGLPLSTVLSSEQVMQHTHPDDRAKLRAQLGALGRGESPSMSLEYRVQRPDGEERVVKADGRLYFDEHDKPQRVVGTLLDVTELARATESLRITQAAMLSSINAIAMVDMAGRIKSVNPAFVRLFHLGTESVAQGQRVQDFALDAQAASAMLESTLGQGGWQGHWQALRADGTRAELQVSSHVVKGAQGEPICIMLSCLDVTERVKAERALRQLNDELEQRVRERTGEALLARDEAERANHAKSEFLSRMSHELRTPLNAIVGFAQLLELGDPAPGQRDSIREIQQAGWHLLALINEVLELSKIEAGATSVSIESVELAPLVAQCMSMVTTQARQRNVQLAVTQDSPQGARVNVDRVRLKQVLVNLLSNAIKYNREGGGVELRWSCQNGVVRLSVSDTGLGIAPARMGELFTPFNRLGAESSLVEGVGIGLALTRKLVELMSGRIGVESVEGEGSTFWIELPEATEPVAEMAVETDVVDEAVPKDIPGHHRVLYIEDNPSNLRLVELILARQPEIELLSALDPLEGLALAEREDLDLILLDIHLPGIDGFEVLRRLRLLPGKQAVPVIAVSANAMPRDIERALAVGFNEYITKPIEIRRLQQVVQRYLAASSEH